MLERRTLFGRLIGLMMELIRFEHPVVGSGFSDSWNPSVYLSSNPGFSWESRVNDADRRFFISASSDDELDLENLHEDELQLYFNKLIPPAMQRGRVEGQEIPVPVSSGPFCTRGATTSLLTCVITSVMVRVGSSQRSSCFI